MREEKNEKSTSFRQSNIELLRIVSMFLIVASHYASHGIVDVNEVYLASNVSLFNRMLCVIMTQWGGRSWLFFHNIRLFFDTKGEGEN